MLSRDQGNGNKPWQYQCRSEKQASEYCKARDKAGPGYCKQGCQY
jgi:hypothetical protein